MPDSDNHCQPKSHTHSDTITIVY